MQIIHHILQAIRSDSYWLLLCLKWRHAKFTLHLSDGFVTVNASLIFTFSGHLKHNNFISEPGESYP